MKDNTLVCSIATLAHLPLLQISLSIQALLFGLLTEMIFAIIVYYFIKIWRHVDKKYIEAAYAIAKTKLTKPAKK